MFQKKVSNEETNYIMIPDGEDALTDTVKNLESFKKITYLVGYKDPEGGLKNYKKKFSKEASSKLR